jgi:hypothetical protein
MHAGQNRPWVAASCLSLALTGCSRSPEPLASCPFRCVLRAGSAAVECAAPSASDRRWTPPSVPSESSEITRVAARNASGVLHVDVELRGGFVEAVDQNVYLFLGTTADARSGASWSLSDDPAYFEGLGYPVRAAVTLPGEPARRIAILSPRVESYSPQVYERRRGDAAVTGPAAPLTLTQSGTSFEVAVDLSRLLGGTAAADDELWVTVATARDYVGFISDATVDRVPSDGREVSATPTSPTMHYPRLEPRSHELTAVSVARGARKLEVDLRTLEPVRDWAQTNVGFYFFALPTPRLARRPRDASKSFELPAGWSYYCAVYSPVRVFCRRPDPTTWSYDESYSGRSRLDLPAGVHVDTVGGELRLGVDAEAAGVGSGDVGVMVTVGRDGFAPTSVYGVGALPAGDGALCTAR